MEPQPGSVGRRLHGIDLARGLAMFAMVATHYVWPDAGAGPGDTGFAADVVRAFGGRAMPLFMLLGGVGLSLLSRRAGSLDRGFVVRAGWLFALGLILDVLTDTIAVVLQFYGLLFLLAPIWRRLPGWAMLALAGGATAIGSWSFQVIGQPRRTTPWHELLDGVSTIQSLLVDGYYPFFPVFAFFALGVVIGRMNLADRWLAAALAAGGAVIGLGLLLAAPVLVEQANVIVAVPDSNRTFEWSQLLNIEGHSQMPMWVLSAAGTSVMVLGLCLLLADGLLATGRRVLVLYPITTLGTMSLSFYAFQVCTSGLFPSPLRTPIGQEWANVAVLYIGFACFAVLWRLRFSRGPLEALIRTGTGR